MKSFRESIIQEGTWAEARFILLIIKNYKICEDIQITLLLIICIRPSSDISYCRKWKVTTAWKIVDFDNDFQCSSSFCVDEFCWSASAPFIQLYSANLGSSWDVVEIDAGAYVQEGQSGTSITSLLRTELEEI